MVMHKVKITVTGTAGSGKSTVAAAIAKLLAEAGADVSFSDDNFGHSETYHTLIRNLKSTRVEDIIKQTTIEVETRQTNRTGP